MNLTKIKPFRNKKYLKWVRSLPCIMSGRTDNVIAHHIIACQMGGGMGTKASDLFAIPMNTEEHARLHGGETIHYIDQKAEALRTIEKAVNEGVLIMSDPND